MATRKTTLNRSLYKQQTLSRRKSIQEIESRVFRSSCTLVVTHLDQAGLPRTTREQSETFGRLQRQRFRHNDSGSGGLRKGNQFEQIFPDYMVNDEAKRQLGRSKRVRENRSKKSYLPPIS